MDDNQRYSQIISECLKASSEALNEIKKFKEFSKETIPKTEDGISFFDVKNHEMLAYLTNLSYLMAKMSVGESIENDASVNRLIKARVVLEKMKPIEGKLRPQVDRLIGAKSAKTGESSLRARPDQFIVSDKEDDDTENEDAEEKPKKYVPPKIHALQYDGDAQEKEARNLERAKRRAVQSSLIRDLRAQYSEAPEEVFDEFRAKESKTEKERRQYEEANFVRLQLTKKEQAQEKRRQNMSDLDTLLNFGDYMADGERKKGVKRKRPNFSGGGSGKGKGAKRFKKSSSAGKKGGKRKSFKKK